MSELEEVAARVQKLLALGRRGGTPAEAEAAMAKAMELLARHNLDLAMVEQGSFGSAVREKAAAAGGMYLYQRHLWREVAALNFCIYLRHQVLEREPGRTRLRWRFKHMLVGRRVNTAAAIAQGTYLEQVCDRLCRERLQVRINDCVISGNVGNQFFTSWAVAFREGIADEVIAKLRDRRAEVEAGEARAARAAARAAASAGSSASTTLTLQVYKSREHDANIDFLHGEGTAARWAAERAERAAFLRAEAERLTRLAAEDPAAFAAEEAARRTARRRSPHSSPRSRYVDRGGYHAGREVGEGVGIDPQVARDERRIGRA